MDGITQLELTFTHFLQGWGDWLTPVMQFFTFIGSEEFFLVVIPLLLWCLDFRLGIRIGIMLIVANSVISPLKLAFHTPRPYWVDPEVIAFDTESLFGIPSGHTLIGTGIWGLLAAALKKWWLTITACIIILMIGLSRIYLGVHFTTDVLAGWTIGILVLILFLYLEKPVAAWFNKMRFGGKLLLAVVFSALTILIGLGVRWSLGDWTVPQEWISHAALQWPNDPIDPLSMEIFVTVSALSFGLIVGLALLGLTRSAFRVDGSFIQRAARYLIGMLALLALYLGLRAIFPSEPVGTAQVFRFVRYALVGVWVTFGAPWLFIRVKLAGRA